MVQIAGQLLLVSMTSCVTLFGSYYELLPVSPKFSTSGLVMARQMQCPSCQYRWQTASHLTRWTLTLVGQRESHLMTPVPAWVPMMTVMAW